MNKITVICLGVKNMQESIRFYRDGLGFKSPEQTDDSSVLFFNTTGTKFELCSLDLLALDIDKNAPPQISKGFSGITLAYNVKDKNEVHEVIELARQAGAAIVKEPQDVSWGGYHGYFADPNGYYWEVVYNPYWTFDENDMLVL
jgi:catechol 2,3-dioxygenase-like lactoylglutathione lyase family enzyme